MQLSQQSEAGINDDNNLGPGFTDRVADLENYIVDDDGNFVVDPPPDPWRLSLAEEDAATEVPPYPLEDTFRLQSDAGASQVIYLDFDGHTTTDTAWNWRYSNGAPIVTPAYDLDGDPATFSPLELERIQNIWERVAEDFIPFDVDVTTQDPGVEALRNTGGGDTEWGVRVAIGGSSDDWLKRDAGGVAYVGSFTLNSDTPAFVFEDRLANGQEKYTAEAVSHEVGHTLGLRHDGTDSFKYYSGHGSGPTGWAPIMGSGYSKELVQWSLGEYPNANNGEDDLNIITTSNGFGYRRDDHGNTAGSATPLAVAPDSTVFGEGIIERNTDVDYFEFTTGTGTIDVEIEPFYRSPNLDILATLYGADGSPIDSSNPDGLLDAHFSLNLDAGTYYLSVEGAGRTGDGPSGPDYGYSDYGSLGSYSISGTIAGAEIDLFGTSFDIEPKNLFGAGLVTASFDLLNQGKDTTGPFDVRFYLSDDTNIDPASDTALEVDSNGRTAYRVDGLGARAWIATMCSMTRPSRSMKRTSAVVCLPTGR